MELPIKWTQGNRELIAVTADWHVPLTNRVFVQSFFDRIESEYARTKTLFVIGDLFNFDALSNYSPKQASASLAVELPKIKDTLLEMSQYFNKIVLTKGNHDMRLLRKLEWATTFQESIRMVLHDIPNSLKKKLIISDHDHCYLLDKSNRDWFLAHPTEYSRIPLRIPRELADIHKCHVMTGHSHHSAVGYDKSGKYTCVELGGFFDNEAFDFTKATTTFPRWQIGYALITYEGKLIVESGQWAVTEKSFQSYPIRRGEG